MTSTVTQATIDVVMANPAANQYAGIAIALLVAILALQVLLHPGDADASTGANRWAIGLNVAIVPLGIAFLMIAGSAFATLISGPG